MRKGEVPVGSYQERAVVLLVVCQRHDAKHPVERAANDTERLVVIMQPNTACIGCPGERSKLHELGIFA